MTYAADPAALQGAVAAGVLGCGTVILGAAREARRPARQTSETRSTPARRPTKRPRRSRASIARRSKPLAGFGHPLHKPVDPRAERMIALARERGIAGRGVDAATRLAAAAARVWEQAAADERVDGDRRDAARRRRSRRDHPRRADPRAHRRPDRPSRRRGGDADRLLHGLAGRGGDRLRRARARRPNA